MVDNLISLSGGATESNIVFTGAPACAGLFAGGQSAVPGLETPFPDAGVVLSSGNPVNLPDRHLSTRQAMRISMPLLDRPRFRAWRLPFPMLA
jgi:hypothetical protein